MILHLDTTFLVDLLRERARREQGPAFRFLERHLDDELRVSVFVASELYLGAERSERPASERDKVDRLIRATPMVFPDESFAPLYGRLLADLQRAGQVIATMDLLIATTAVASRAPLVTRNARHFERVAELPLVAY